MPNLLTSFNSAAASLSAYERAIGLVQNDTVNASTPGYVRQTPSFQSLPFDAAGAQAGGVAFGAVLSSRDEYAEHNVQVAQTSVEYSSTLASHLSAIEPLFDLQSDTGVAGSLNALFSAFSQLSVSPNSSQSRQGVINAASGLATAFNVSANGLSTAASSVDLDIRNTVTALNNIVSDISKLNTEFRKQSPTNQDPSLEARLYVDLEQLSQYAGITITRSQDNSVNVYLGGVKPLLVGNTQYSLTSASTSSGTIIQDPDGNDISATISGGQLGALLQVRNTLIPNYQNQLNSLASAVSTTFNNQMASGVDSSGNPGAPLFQIPVATAAAQSIAVSSTITSAQIAAASAANPGGNDNALAASTLQNSPIASLSNFTLTQYFGNLSAVLGRDVSNAQNDSTTQNALLAQAKSLRTQSSSVSLDEEAARLIEYQRAYEATSKLISVIDNMTETLLGLIPS